MALALDLAPAADQPALQLALERSLLRDPHLRGGIFTVKWLLQTLNLDQALVAVMKKTYPSFGFMLAQNATTLWESWFFSDSVYRSEK
jgi:alpha-L-rhamnosidase